MPKEVLLVSKAAGMDGMEVLGVSNAANAVLLRGNRSVPYGGMCLSFSGSGVHSAIIYSICVLFSFCHLKAD